MNGSSDLLEEVPCPDDLSCLDWHISDSWWVGLLIGENTLYAIEFGGVVVQYGIVLGGEVVPQGISFDGGLELTEQLE